MSEQAIPVRPTVEEAQLEAEGVPEVGRMSLWQLTWRRFLRNRLAVTGGIILIFFYLMVIFADFLAPYDYTKIAEDYIFVPPQWPRFIDREGRFHLRPFVYGIKTTLDTENLRWIHEPDYEQIYPIRFFVRGWPYKLFGLIPTDVHLFGVDEPGTVFIFGTDRVGQHLGAHLAGQPRPPDQG